MLGTGPRKITAQRLDPNEAVETVLISLDQIRAKIWSGEIHVLGTVAGILPAFNQLKMAKV